MARTFHYSNSNSPQKIASSKPKKIQLMENQRVEKSILDITNAGARRFGPESSSHQTLRPGSRFLTINCSWFLNRKDHYFRGRIQPPYMGVIIQLLSTMDIPVGIYFNNSRVDYYFNGLRLTGPGETPMTLDPAKRYHLWRRSLFPKIYKGQICNLAQGSSAEERKPM